MSSTQTPVPPSVMWAQRPLEVLLTINLEDCKDPEVKFDKDSVFFKGTGGVDQKPHEVKIPLFKEIDPEKSKSFNRGRCIELSLIKANPDGPYWPSLTSDGKKHHWLKCDFNKWQDEDESGDESAGGGMPGMGGMGGMPGMGGMGGMPGMGGMGGGGDLAEMMRQMGGLGGGAGSATKPSFDEFDANNEDSDDEDLPDLE